MTLRAVPYLLIAFRLLAGPAMLLLAWRLEAAARVPCAVILALGVLSDIFDGVIARRIGSVTDRLRTFDSRTDLIFWSCVTAAMLLLHPSLLAATWPMVAVLAALELTTHAISFARFRREASPHHLLSKLFALALWALLTLMLIEGRGGPLQLLVFVMGIASQLEAMAIMLTLPAWRPDVRGLREALRLRAAARA
ncbi:CDP-alcohol phosphatidyltransferase family protein [Phenylobacterium sp.]|uniref:CDP-alcohol phosphatidyltransferase family protein n=1 Tax=Phenylobacterium sp. TaxID=1871053 RepID=UPI003BAD90C1